MRASCFQWHFVLNTNPESSFLPITMLYVGSMDVSKMVAKNQLLFHKNIEIAQILCPGKNFNMCLFRLHQGLLKSTISVKT